MNREARTYIQRGALAAGMAVFFGAWGAHRLRPVLSVEALSWFQTAVAYQFVHAVALMFLGLLSLQCLFQAKLLRWASALFQWGILLFCGSLYALALGSPKGVGLLTPVGGIFWLIAWFILAFGKNP